MYVHVYDKKGWEYMKEIPEVIQLLYNYWRVEPDKALWPECISDPVEGYGLYSFYQGLSLGLQLAEACQEK